MEGSTGFRALTNTFQTLREWITSLGAPAHTTIRQWLFKLGLYMLERPKNVLANWFYIIDTSIQMGLQKCVLIVGVKQQDLTENFCPTFEQLEPLVLKPLNSCPGEIIKNALEEAFKKTGKPIAIISDKGSELKKGVTLLSDHEKPLHLFDVSHKVNACLKNELDADITWKTFQKAASNSTQRLKLSSLSHLCPPRQRTKERMHSAFALIKWGLRLFNFMKSDKGKKLSIEDQNKIIWIEEYQFCLPTYKSLMEISKKALQLVHNRGYYQSIADDFIKQTEELCLGNQRCIDFQKKLREILYEEGKKVPDGQHYLGSSEIIESVFGKFKQIEGYHASSGLTSLVLGIPALVGKIDEAEIYKAMHDYSVVDLENWFTRNMGQTFLSKRRHDLQQYENHNAYEDLDVCEIYEKVTA